MLLPRGQFTESADSPTVGLEDSECEPRRWKVSPSIQLPFLAALTGTDGWWRDGKEVMT